MLLTLVTAACTRQVDEDLVRAASVGDVDQMRILLSQGADIEAAAFKDWTPLTAASANGHLDAVMLLVSSGAQVDAPAPGGVTALQEAATNGRVEVVAYLLRAGAKPSAMNAEAKRYVLETIRTKSYKPVEELLVKYGFAVPPE